MTIIEKGLYLEMTNRSNNRVVFTASTDELTKEVFDGLWARIGDLVFNKSADTDQISYYEIRVTPLGKWSD